MEGFSNNAFGSLYGDAPTVSTGAGAMKASAYQKTQLAPGVSFATYKRPTAIRTPRGDYNAAAPQTMSASDYLRRKYGDFSGAVEVGPPPAPEPPQTKLMGTTALTVGDLKLLQNTIDMELIRLTNLRIQSAVLDIRKRQLEYLAESVGNFVGSVERGEMRGEDVPIFPATARVFLKTFRDSEAVPELLDPEGKTPASLMPVAQAPAPVQAQAQAPAPAPAPDSKSFLSWLYENVQALKWSLEADYQVEQAKQREIRNDLGAMEKRILSYSYTDTPMPMSYQSLFLEKIRGIQSELKQVPE